MVPPASSMISESWFHFLTTDGQTVGVVTWIGLLVTIAGFGIALAQIRKIKRSAEAASDAVARLTKVVRSHEQNIHITNAYGHLTWAQTMIKQGNTDAAVAYLSVGWTALIAARELTDDAVDRRHVDDLIVATRRLFDDVGAPSAKLTPSWIAVRRNADINKILNDLGTLSVKMNTVLSGIGSTS